MKPYIVRFIAVGKGKGKTYIASRVVEVLRKKGYSIGIIKHTVHSVKLDEKDSSRYIATGVDVVAVSSPNMLAIYRSSWIDDLEKVIEFVWKPIIVVEGFREAKLGDAIAVVDALDELEELTKITNVTAVVSKNNAVVSYARDRGFTAFNMDEIDRVSEFIENRAIEFIESQLPRVNCGMCGYSTCKAFAMAYLYGKEIACPRISDVKLVVDGKYIPINPFVKRMLQKIIKGFIESLKGVPSDMRRIYIEIEY